MRAARLSPGALLVTGALLSFVWTSLAWTAPALADPPLSDELAALDAHLLRAPHDVDALAQRAETLLLAGEAERALSDVELGTSLSPRDARFVLLRAGCLVALGRDHEAIATLDDGAIAAMREPFSALAMRGRIQLRMGELALAVQDLDHALTRIPDPDLFLLRADAQTRLGDLEGAVAGLAEGTALTGAAVLEQALIDALLRDDRAGEALDILVHAGRTLAPVRRHLFVARVARSLGLESDAEYAASEALSLSRAHALSRPSAAHHLELASALVLFGHCDEARLHFAAAEDLAPAYARSDVPGLGRIEDQLAACVEGAR